MIVCLHKIVVSLPLFLLLLHFYSLANTRSYQDLICDEEQQNFYYEKINLSEGNDNCWLFFCGFNGTGNGSTVMMVNSGTVPQILLKVSDIRSFEMLNTTNNGYKDISILIREESDVENVSYKEVTDTFSFDNFKYNKVTNHSKNIITDEESPELLKKLETILSAENKNKVSLSDIHKRSLELYKADKKTIAAESLFVFIKNENIILSSNNLTIFNDLAYFFEQTKQHSRAETILLEITQKFPERTVAWLNLGDAQSGLGKSADAKQAYNRYVELMKKAGKEAKVPRRVLELTK